MPDFKYTYETKLGVKSGVIEADDVETATAILRRQKIHVKTIKKASQGVSLFGGGPTAKDISIFTRQFATMIASGLPLVQCLNILAESSENKSFAKALNDIRKRVETGETFADSLRKHPKIFDHLYTNMVEAGEVGGILDTIMRKLAEYNEKALALKAKVKSAMIYPAIIVLVAVTVVSFLMIFVIPTFAGIFQDFGSELPAVTQLALNISNVFVTFWYLILAIPVGLIFGIKYARKTEKGMYVTDRLLFTAPVIGPLLKKVAVAKFTRTMGTLTASGVPIIDGLNITARTAGNKVIEYAVVEVIADIKQGKGLAEPLREQGVFPMMVIQMIEVGEQTGALDTMMEKIADFYDEEVDTAVAGLTSMLEPLLMVFLGVVVGFIVIAMYMPIFKMGDAI
ncbi:MAG: type II secretion system F family protein [Nitrospinota bacterium]